MVSLVNSEYEGISMLQWVNDKLQKNWDKQW